MLALSGAAGLLKIGSFIAGTLFVFFSVKAIMKETNKAGR